MLSCDLGQILKSVGNWWWFWKTDHIIPISACTRGISGNWTWFWKNDHIIPILGCTRGTSGNWLVLCENNHIIPILGCSTRTSGNWSVISKPIKIQSDWWSHKFHTAGLLSFHCYINLNWKDFSEKVMNERNGEGLGKKYVNKLPINLLYFLGQKNRHMREPIPRKFFKGL